MATLTFTQPAALERHWTLSGEALSGTLTLSADFAARAEGVLGDVRLALVRSGVLRKHVAVSVNGAEVARLQENHFDTGLEGVVGGQPLVGRISDGNRRYELLVGGAPWAVGRLDALGPSKHGTVELSGPEDAAWSGLLALSQLLSMHAR